MLFYQNVKWIFWFNLRIINLATIWAVMKDLIILMLQGNIFNKFCFAPHQTFVVAVVRVKLNVPLMRTSWKLGLFKRSTISIEPPPMGTSWNGCCYKRCTWKEGGGVKGWGVETPIQKTLKTWRFVVVVFSLEIDLQVFESLPRAPPKCGLSGGRLHCNTVSEGPSRL